MHMFPVNHLQMSSDVHFFRISVISLRPRSPPPGVDEIAAVAKAITETEGGPGGLGGRKAMAFARGPWAKCMVKRGEPGETR